MKIEFVNIANKNKHLNEVVKKEKHDFSEIIKKSHNQQGRKFNVYTIAAKIARGEFVTGEELAYIKQHAPSLFAAAREQNKERKEGITSKEGKETNTDSQVSKNSENINENSTKINVDLSQDKVNNLFNS